MGRFPIDIYRQPVRGILTYFIPVAIMMTYPAKAFFGLVNFQGILLAIGIAGVFMFISLRFWNFALKKYTSASS